MPRLFVIPAKSDSYLILLKILKKFFQERIPKFFRHFLPFGRVNLTASASS